MRRILSLVTAACLLPAFAWSDSDTAGIAWYPYGEKPILSQPIPRGRALDFEVARGEFEIFSARLSDGPALAPASHVQFAWKGNVGGEKTGDLQIDTRIYVMAVHHLKKSSFGATQPAGEVPDILIPNSWIATKRIQVPLANLPSKPLYLFEIRIPEDSPVGKFSGEFSFSVGRRQYLVPVHLTIHSTVLPKVFEQKASFGFAPWQVLQKHFGKWTPDEGALYRQYEELALEHRIDLHKIYLKFPERSADDPLTDGSVADQSYLAQVEPLFDGHLSPLGFKMGVTDLPVPEEMKSLSTSGGSEAFEAELAQFWKRMDTSVMKHDLRDKTFVYYTDEPKAEAYKRIGKDLRAIRQWAPDLRFLLTGNYNPALEGGVTIWCVNLINWQERGMPSPQLYEKRKKDYNEDFWFYVSCNSHGCEHPQNFSLPDLMIDRPSAYQRAFPLEALRFDAGGVLYYDTVFGYSHGETDSPWVDAFSFKGYGEGNLFYPCTPDIGGCADPKVAPSLRMKVLRDGFEDVQILRMAREKGAQVDQWLAEFMPNARTFKKTTQEFDELKRRALRALDETTPSSK